MPDATSLLLETLGWLESYGYRDAPGTFNGLIGRLRAWRDTLPDRHGDPLLDRARRRQRIAPETCAAPHNSES